MENKNDEISLSLLILDEEIRRKEIQRMRSRIPVLASAYFQARRSGVEAASEKARLAVGNAKAEIAEKEGFYRTNADALINKLKADIAYINAEKLEGFRDEAERSLSLALVHYQEIVK